MDKITRQVRIEHWTQIMNECLNSGMNKTEWCRANGISDKQFFYWQRILRNRILISNPIFHSEIYSVSRRTISSKSVMSLRPLTCHIPVIPGLIAILARWCSSYCSSSSGRIGRVPANVNIGTTFFQK